MKLLEMSISAGVLITLLALVRIMGISKLPKRTFVMLWIVVMIRLLLPVSLPIRKGIATPVLHVLQNKLYILWHFLGMDAHAESGMIPGAASFVLTEDVDKNMLLSSNASLVMYGVWITGMVGFGIYFTLSFMKEYRMLAQAVPLQHGKLEEGKKLAESFETARRLAGIHQNHNKKSQLFIYDRIHSPLVWGIVRQRIVFPKSLQYMEPSQIQYMLTHEMIHIKRRDNLWKLMSAVVVCIHWFNPMVWLMYLLLARDLELSCDEQVLTLYGRKSREEYAMTLLALVQNQNEKTLFCSGFEKNPTKERIVAIMKYKNLTIVGIFSAVILLAGAVTVFASNDISVVNSKEISAEDQDNDLVSYTMVESSVQDQDKKQNQSNVDTNTDSVLIHVDDKIDSVIDGKEIGDYYYISGEWDEDELLTEEKDSSIVSVDGKKFAIKNFKFVKGGDGK